AAAFGGLWLALIGWFLTVTARAEALQQQARERLGGIRVAELMARDPVSVDPDVTVGAFMDEVARRTRYTTYPVIEGERPVGLLTFGCVAEIPRERWDRSDVRECMLPRERVPVLSPDEDAAEALVKLSGSGVHRALVVDGERLVGLLSITDLMRAMQLGPLNDARRDDRRAAV
ncbi:MAG TPA: CBS domain-containing protein, partial [Solirubrobacteraceae bacterium]|nr:CBS domain-containing protein [Solirubrobacteraceae bacterium]